jgi:hypothetical protein
LACPTCSADHLRGLGNGDGWCPRCGTLVVCALPGINPEVTMPVILEDILEWRQQYKRPTDKEFSVLMKGIRDE